MWLLMHNFKNFVLAFCDVFYSWLFAREIFIAAWGYSMTSPSTWQLLRFLDWSCHSMYVVLLKIVEIGGWFCLLCHLCFCTNWLNSWRWIQILELERKGRRYRAHRGRFPALSWGPRNNASLAMATRALENNEVRCQISPGKDMYF